MSEVSLHLGGVKVTGWTSVEVTRSMESVVDSFSIGYFYASDPSDVRRYPYDEGTECELHIDGEPVVDGYLDEVEISASANEYSTQLVGQSKAQQLVKSTAVHRGGQWRDQRISSIVRDLAEPYGFSVEVEADEGDRLDRFKLEEGETAFEAIDRAARKRGLLVLSGRDKVLRLTRVASGRPVGSLHDLANTITRTRGGSFGQRHSVYIVKGRSVGKGDLFGAEQVRGVVRVADAGVDLFSPLVQRGKGRAGPKDLQRQGQWVRNVRAGRSRRVSYTVDSWKTERGDLWEPNTLYQLTDDLLWVDEVMVLASVSLRLDDQGGDVAQLEFARPEAFDPEPAPEKRTKKRKSSAAY